MESVPFNCESCGKLMAVVPADLGKQVECPHCHQTVQAPLSARPAGAEASLPEFQVSAPAEQESIFTPQEQSAEDLFGAVTAPKVEMPPSPNLEVEPLPGPTEASNEPAPLPETPVAEGLPETPEVPPPVPLDFTPAAAAGALIPPVHAEAAAPPTGPELTSDMPAPVPPRRPQGRGLLVPLLLIFLIPYSLVATAAVALLIYQQRQVSTPFDPLERLPDPKPSEGGPKRIKHDSPLPDKLKTSLNQPLQIGDLEITPLAVERSPRGELVLKLKLKNISRDVAFDPLPDMFLRYAARSLDDVKPYSFLALGPDSHQRIYGAYLDRVSTPRRPGGGSFDGVLWPGQEEIVSLRTEPKYKRLVDQLDRAKGPLLWRIQVRRGFVQVKGKDVSATAVVGVRIDPRAIPLAPAEDARRQQSRPLLHHARSENPEFFKSEGKSRLLRFGAVL